MKNKLYFVSEISSLVLDEQELDISFPVPSQLPASISEDDLKKKGEQAQETLMALFIVLLVLQLALKTVLEKMFLMVLTIQIVQNYSLYGRSS